MDAGSSQGPPAPASALVGPAGRFYLSTGGGSTARARRGERVSSYEFLSRTLIEKYNVDAGAVRPEATMTELGLDSLSLAELMFDLEDEFGVEIPDDRTNLSTLGGAAALIDELRAKTA